MQVEAKILWIACVATVALSACADGASNDTSSASASASSTGVGANDNQGASNAGGNVADGGGNGQGGTSDGASNQGGNQGGNSQGGNSQGGAPPTALCLAECDQTCNGTGTDSMCDECIQAQCLATLTACASDTTAQPCVNCNEYLQVIGFGVEDVCGYNMTAAACTPQTSCALLEDLSMCICGFFP